MSRLLLSTPKVKKFKQSDSRGRFIEGVHTMKNTIYESKESLSYTFDDKRATIKTFAESCIANEGKAESYTDNAYLISTAGVVCMLIQIEKKEGNKREVNKHLKQFIAESFDKAGLPVPNERMLQRRVQLARFVFDNNQHLREHTTTPPALIREAIQVVSKYKTYRALLESATQSTGKAKVQANESEKMLKRVDALFKDLAKMDARESESIIQYIKDKADAFGKAKAKKAEPKAKAKAKAKAKKVA